MLQYIELVIDGVYAGDVNCNRYDVACIKGVKCFYAYNNNEIVYVLTDIKSYSTSKSDISETIIIDRDKEL